MNRKLSEEDLQYIKNNWTKITNRNMAKELKVTVNHITKIGRDMGLQDKREFMQDLIPRKVVSKQVEGYSIGPESIKEIEGRNNTLKLLRIMELLEENSNIKIKLRKSSDFTDTDKILKGIIIFKNERLIVVKTEHYPESFKYTDFYTGRAVII